MKANAVRSQVLDKLLGAVNWTPPATYYVALYTTAPNESGGGVEVAGGAYARIAVANSLANFPAAVSGVKSNGTLIQFPTATALWGSVVGWGFHSAASGDTLVLWGVLDDPTLVDVGTGPAFASGALQFEET
jgi:hypothetical protein